MASHTKDSFSRLSHRLALALVVLGCGRCALADPKKSPGDDPPSAATGHDVMKLFVGAWRVSEHHFDARGKEIATVRGGEEINWILDRQAIRRTYSTTATGYRFRAIGTLTWNQAAKRFEGVWFDNQSKTGPTYVEGRWNSKTSTMLFSVRTAGPDGEKVEYEIVERLVDHETRTATTYSVNGEERLKRMEREYKRTIPCPSGKEVHSVGSPFEGG